MKKIASMKSVVTLVFMVIGTFTTGLNDGSVGGTSTLQMNKAPTEDIDLDGKVEGDQNLVILTTVREALISPGIGDVVHTIPAPGSNAEGLTWDGQYLWNSDIDDEMIYKLNPQDGSVLASIPSPRKFVEGLAWDGEYLWAAGQSGGPGLDAKIYQLNPIDGTIIHSFPAPGANPWPHGITYDGQGLWVNDFVDKLLYKVNPFDGTVISSIPAPGNGSIGLTWDGRYLWIGDFSTDYLYQIDPSDDTIIQTITSPHTNPRDLAWDGQYIWVASWESATIYQVDVSPSDIVYLALIVHNHMPSVTFPLYIGDAIPVRPVVYQGEVFYTSSVQIPDELPAGGRFYFSSQQDAVAEVLVDDELAVLLDGAEVFAYNFSTSGYPVPATVQVPRTTMEQLAGQTVTVKYQDIYAYVVEASAMWLIWIP